MSNPDEQYACLVTKTLFTQTGMEVICSNTAFPPTFIQVQKSTFTVIQSCHLKHRRNVIYLYINIITL